MNGAVAQNTHVSDLFIEIVDAATKATHMFFLVAFDSL